MVLINEVIETFSHHNPDNYPLCSCCRCSRPSPGHSTQYPVPVQYCSVPVLIAESLTLEGPFTVTGMKISISQGYKSDEDELVYTASIGNIVGSWSAAQGYYLLKGDANTTANDYRDAVRSISYKNNSSYPTLGLRRITVSLEDADYLPATGHFTGM